MKSVFISRAFLFITLCVAMYACTTKNSNLPTPAATGKAGKGGLATMYVAMNHDSIYVDTGMVYVKYDAVVKPVDNKYDDSAKLVMVQGKPVAIFTHLTVGNYFIYGKGWDIIRSKTVAGTRPYTIDASASNGISQLILLVNQQ